MNLPGILVSPAWLSGYLTHPGVVIVDVRWSPRGGTGVARREFEDGHVPGAAFLDLDRDLSAKPFRDGPGRHPLPSPEAFAETMAAIGVDDEMIVITYDDVRVPLENQLGRAGSGHQAAQDRLGAGRVYHCMNSIGQMWRAFDLMVERATMREVHGGKLETKQFVQGFIADSYIDIQAARLMTIHCAERMDGGGDPRTDISAIKIFVPAAYERVVDRAIQVWGAAGVSGDLPLAAMYQGARTLRLADGPDEVHRILIAKNVLSRYHAGESWDFGN